MIVKNITPAAINRAQTRNNTQNKTTNRLKQQNFKGRILNDKNLNALGTTAIGAFWGTQVASMTMGLYNSFLYAANTALFSVGLGAQIARFFIKEGEFLRLKPNIAFKKAETLEQAANFANENFKIKNFNVDNLDTANWINEGLTILSNKFKGKTFMPDNIALFDFGPDALKKGSVTGACYSPQGNTILFNKGIYKVVDNLIEKNLAAFPEYLWAIPISNPKNAHCRELDKMLYLYRTNPANLTLAEKTSFFSSLIQRAEVLTKILAEPEKLYGMSVPLSKDVSDFTDISCNVNYNKFAYLFHEAGHMFDFKTKSIAEMILAKRRNPAIFEKGKEQLILPQNTSLNYKEFNAEVFSGIINGDRYPKIIMDLFKKLSNIKLPKDM